MKLTTNDNSIKMNIIEKQDIKEFAQSFGLSDEIQGTTFLITGSTGLIGAALIHCLVSLNKEIRIIAPVRNVSKALGIFDELEKRYITFIECDILKYDYNQLIKVDYIIHCAAPTSSKFFVERPVETSEIIIDGTKILLNYARTHAIKGFVYLSSLEVYGSILDDNQLVTEDVQGYIDTMSVRSSYPMAKRASENLCCLYAEQFKVPVKVVRLTQTTGAGLAQNDNRVIAQFARLAVLGEDIVLHTTGEAARSYCYTTDAVSAILYVLLRGQAGEAYNVANEETYISAKAMAEYIRDNFNPSIHVRIELNSNMGYAPVTKLKLSSQKLKGLGWEAQVGLRSILERIMKVIDYECKS